MQLSRDDAARLWRPKGPQNVDQRNWANGGAAQIPRGFDLSTPLEALRLIFTGRVDISVANMASTNPESFLNLITRILFYGQNKRQGGESILYDMDLATLFAIQHLFSRRPAVFQINGVNVAEPTSPYPTFQTLNIGTYDFRIEVDLPFAPFDAHPGVKPGWLVRAAEWGDSLQLRLEFGRQDSGAVAGALGTGAAGTVVAITAFGSGAGVPLVEIQSIPAIMGNLRNTVIPGMLSRVTQPTQAALTAALANGSIIQLQKLATTRIFLKAGTSTLPNGNPAFVTLSDAVVTSLGLRLGTTRSVRNLLSIFSHKLDVQRAYPSAGGIIQGYTCIDFISSGNPDSAFPADQIKEGSYLDLLANVTATVNGYGLVMQEQMILQPEGELYS